MPVEDRYTITLTDSAHKLHPKQRVIYRSSRTLALEAAARELRRHVNTAPGPDFYDGWRLYISEPPQWTPRLVAEVRPGYDSRTPPAGPSSDPDGFPF